MKRLWKFLILLAITVSVSTCRMVTDPGVSVTNGRVEQALSARHKACTKICDRIHNKAKEEELELHKEILEKCEDLPWDQEKPCRDAEHERYRQAKNALEQQKKACKQGCAYGEGGGAVGR